MSASVMAMGDWTIEPLHAPTDIDGILAVEAASFTNPWTREMYLAELQQEGRAFFLLARTADRRVVGFCSFWRVLDEVHINNLAVLPTYRRRGIARALLNRMFADAAGWGAVRALLEVRRSNAEAQRLYEAMGFTVAGVRRGYYSHPVEDALVFWREPLALRPST
ncbi:MAG: ribosomal protein S18-alanine N-acetyltransferase [Vicinamibacterales bacterium]